jgi:rSAM/selenodomain-associated transferase 1
LYKPNEEDERDNAPSMRCIVREVRVPNGLSPHAGKYAIAVMVKAPRDGEVKTRLTPPLRAAEASLLSVCFVKDTLANLLAVSESVAVDCYAAYSPAGSEALFRDLLPQQVRMLPPRSTGLANSLPDAIEDLIALGYEGACLVNADSPTLPTSLLVDAITRLCAPGDRVVLGPATDGGYYLVGLKHPHRHLFHDIAWSTEHVYRQTAERASSIGLELVTLPAWYDVDDAASLSWLCRELLGGRRPPQCVQDGYVAAQTRDYLRALLAAGGDMNYALEPSSR